MNDVATHGLEVDLEGASETIRRRIDELARVGRSRGGGVTRLAYTEAERNAHAVFTEWARQDGAEPTVDGMGNTTAVFRPGVPYFLLGSHLDSVVDGGAFDGVAGVVGALAAAAAVRDRLHHFGLRVVAFAGEEGARFGRPTIGSACAAGLLEAEAVAGLRDAEGVSLAQAARALGFRLDRPESWLGRDVCCFFEIHIEQGRRLEQAGIRIGLVDGIAGSIRVRFDLTGRSDHSGATPMDLRLDALAAASEVVLGVEEIGRQYRSSVATVGRLEVVPNSVTTIPGRARLWADVRDVDAEQQRALVRVLVDRARRIADRRRVALASEIISTQLPVMLHAWPRAIVRAECERVGLPYRVLPSGAGHDAAVVACRAPSCLIFVPCVDGVSHAPAERAEADDIAAAAALVAAAVERADSVVWELA